MQTKYLCVLIHIWIKGEVVAVKPDKALQWNILLTFPRRYSFCGSFMFFFCLVFAMFAPVKCALWSPAGKGLTSWLSLVVSNCEFVTFPLVSWVRCGTWLYQFLIFAPLHTFLNTCEQRMKTIRHKTACPFVTAWQCSSSHGPVF